MELRKCKVSFRVSGASSSKENRPENLLSNSIERFNAGLKHVELYSLCRPVFAFISLLEDCGQGTVKGSSVLSPPLCDSRRMVEYGLGLRGGGKTWALA